MMPVKCWPSISCVSRFSRPINLHLSRPHTGPLTSTPITAAISATPASLAFGVVMVFLPAEVAPECTASRIEYQSRSRGRSR